MTITLRDATAEDEAFLRQVYACTRAEEMALVPWTEEQREAFLRFQFDAQDSYYRSQFPEAAYQIILKDGAPVGRLYVYRNSTDMRILDITILPEHRAAGVGTSLIRDLQAEAEESNQPLNIWVENFNRSQSLFKRLGFLIVQEEGYNNLLEYRAET
jgi:ribosomal protein S18 acetylase RimI-like enzyme